MSQEWGIWRTHENIDEFGKRHSVSEWLKRDAIGWQYLAFDTEGEAKAAAGIYNAMSKWWVHEARRFDGR